MVRTDSARWLHWVYCCGDVGRRCEPFPHPQDDQANVRQLLVSRRARAGSGERRPQRPLFAWSWHAHAQQLSAEHDLHRLLADDPVHPGEDARCPKAAASSTSSCCSSGRGGCDEYHRALIFGSSSSRYFSALIEPRAWCGVVCVRISAICGFLSTTNLRKTPLQKKPQCH